MKHRLYFRRGLSLLLTASLLLALAACGGGRSSGGGGGGGGGRSKNTTASAMRLRRAEGEVSVSDTAGEDVPPRENLGLYSGYGVKTQTKSYAWIDLDEVKLTKMDQDSGIVIEKEGKKLEIEVKSGSLFFNVTEPLKDNESLNIRTSTLLVGIRGTCGWVEDRDGLSRVCLLEGRVECSAGDQSVQVNAGEMAELTADGELTVTPFTDRDIPDFVRVELEEDEDLSAGGEDGPDFGDVGILERLQAARGEEFITLTEDTKITLTGTIFAAGNDKNGPILDLNGHTLTLAGKEDDTPDININGVVEVTDRSGTGLGTLNLNPTGGFALQSGNLEISTEITINGNVRFIGESEFGTLNVYTGATLNGDVDVFGNSLFALRGGTLNGTVQVDGGMFSILGGTANGDVRLLFGTLVLNEGVLNGDVLRDEYTEFMFIEGEHNGEVIFQ